MSRCGAKGGGQPGAIGAGVWSRGGGGRGAEIDRARINDIPARADEPFFVQNPRSGVFGRNLMAKAVMYWLYRIPIRKIQAALKAGGSGGGWPLRRCSGMRAFVLPVALEWASNAVNSYARAVLET